MNEARNLRLLAVMTFVMALSLPSSAYAQPDYIYGSWYGVETATVFTYQNGQLLGVNNYSDYGSELSIGYSPPYSGFQYLSISLDYGSISGTNPQASFGPTSATASISQSGYNNTVSTGNFSADYNEILPDGQIVDDGFEGSAVVDLTLYNVDEFGTGQVIFDSFISVPEPSSIIQAASAMLMIAGFAAWTNRRRRQVPVSAA